MCHCANETIENDDAIQTKQKDYNKFKTQQVKIKPALLEKCPNTEFFLFIFSPNAEKYGPEKTPYLDTFHTNLTLANLHNVYL